ncbi:MAG: molecular chaperone TorD family protein [Rhodothermaceae bacterium]|nr:molecular chaperone TorD family protein [Rhodothermaceae bacterium]
MNEQLSRRDRAIQRQRAYAFLAKTFAEGLSPAVLEMAKELPILVVVLPEEYDQDQASAEHQDLFGFNVLPYAGVYLNEDGQLGGRIHLDLNSWYNAFEFMPSNDSGVPDHITTQLEFLAFLSGLDVKTHESSATDLMNVTILHKQGEFLGTQVVTWIFPFLMALKAQKNPFYSEVAALTEALVISHCIEMGIRRDSVFALPAMEEDILSNKQTGLKDIATFLCRPALSGIYLTRKDIKRIAGSLEIPTGFGDRIQTLSNTLRSAVTFDTLPSLINELRERVLFFKRGYEGLCESTNEGLNQVIKQWILRTEGTLKILDDLDVQLAKLTQTD